MAAIETLEIAISLMMATSSGVWNDNVDFVGVLAALGALLVLLIAIIDDDNSDLLGLAAIALGWFWC